MLEEQFVYLLGIYKAMEMMLIESWIWKQIILLSQEMSSDWIKVMEIGSSQRIILRRLKMIYLIQILKKMPQGTR
jgi:hypothetical protein